MTDFQQDMTCLMAKRKCFNGGRVHIILTQNAMGVYVGELQGDERIRILDPKVLAATSLAGVHELIQALTSVASEMRND